MFKRRHTVTYNFLKVAMKKYWSMYLLHGLVIIYITVLSYYFHLWAMMRYAEW